MKFMDLNEFRNLGLLQEINRQILHPRGLALEMLAEKDGTITGFGRVWDHRDDPNGVVFADAPDPKKTETVAGMVKSRPRLAQFGWITQPPGVAGDQIRLPPASDDPK